MNADLGLTFPVGPGSRAQAGARASSRASGPAFALFILINATLFIRPSEIVPALLGLPIYELLNLACLVLCAPLIAQRLSSDQLSASPITACVIGLQFAVVFSHLAHLNLSPAVTAAGIFIKVLLYYLMLVALVDSPQRLRSFLIWLLCFTTGVTVLALIHYHGYVTIPGMAASYEHIRVDDLEAERDTVVLARLCAAGLFGNPNDLSRILAIGMFLSLYAATSKPWRPTRPLWLGAFLMMSAS
jgi:hypothetical protein